MIFFNLSMLIEASLWAKCLLGQFLNLQNEYNSMFLQGYHKSGSMGSTRHIVGFNV